MINKNIFLLMFCMILLVGNVSAQDFVYQQSTNVDLEVHCFNNVVCSSSAICNITITDPDSINLVDNQAMTQSLNQGYFNYTINVTQTSKIGTYQARGFCKDGGVAENYNFIFWITSDGNRLSTPDALVRIFLIIFFIVVLIGTYLVVRKIDFKRWNDDIIEKYKTKNMVKMVLSGLLYNLMKNVYIIYYLIGLPILMIVQNITYSYNITSLIVFMDVLLLIYTVGIILVGLIFLSYVQEWSIEMLELIKDMDWGIN